MGLKDKPRGVGMAPCLAIGVALGAAFGDVGAEVAIGVAAGPVAEAMMACR